MAISQYELKAKPRGFNTQIYPKEPVIYCIRNIINNKVYIGQTTNFRKRLIYHRHSLQKNKHCSLYLQRAFNKYGINSFKVEILEKSNTENLFNKEVYWIEKMDSSNRNKGYNYLIKSSSPWYGPRSEQHKLNLRKALKGRVVSEEVKNMLKTMNIGRFVDGKSVNSRSIIQYDLKMNKLYTFDSINTAARKLNIGRRSISNCLNGRSKSSGNFIWKFNIS